MTDFSKAKREAFDRIYNKLNNKQKEAVYCVNGPLLVLAGAGSGKTTVLVNRILCLIRYGNAYNELRAELSADEIASAEDYISGRTDTPPELHLSDALPEGYHNLLFIS